MTNLAVQLDSINEAYENPDWLNEAMQLDPISDNDLYEGLHTIYVQDGIIERDTDILVEYYDDIEDEYGTGLLVSWHSDVFIGEENVERAYILRDSGGTTYARFEHINPICEVNENDYQQHAMSMVQDTVTTEYAQADGQFSYGGLFLLSSFASLFNKDTVSA